MSDIMEKEAKLEYRIDPAKQFHVMKTCLNRLAQPVIVIVARLGQSGNGDHAL